MNQMAREFRDNETYLTAMEKYDSRIGDVIDTALKGKQSGNLLVYDIKNSAQVSNAAVTGTLIGMLLPAVQQVRKAARRTESLNRLRMIVLASLNYESAHMRFPRNITDRDGNVLLSWRVAILPFMEQNHLYNQFHMDEPWNSDHNIALLDQMPDIFKSRGFKSDSKTLYQGFEGPGGIFEPGGRGIGFGSITDGSSNTIFCVECDPKSAVEWTRPQDLPFDLEEPITSVGKFRKGNFNAAYCDGSVHTFDFGSIANQLNKLIHRSDGSIINHDSLRRR
jgi:prepilin-type processing-associated H-X9-DG protein